MPAVAAAPLFWGAVATGAAGVGTSVIGSRAQTGASNRAARMTSDANRQAMDFERQRMAEEQRRWDAEQIYARQRDDDMRRQHDAVQAFEREKWDARESRAEPYRQASLGALARVPALMSGNGQRAWRSPSNAGRSSLGDLARRG